MNILERIEKRIADAKKAGYCCWAVAITVDQAIELQELEDFCPYTDPKDIIESITTKTILGKKVFIGKKLQMFTYETGVTNE
jgi:hypothetical protein